MAQAKGKVPAQVSLGSPHPFWLGVWGKGASCRGVLLHICDLDVKICVSGLQFQKWEDFKVRARASLFVRANQPLLSWKQGTEWTEHKVGDRTGFIPTDSLLTLEKFLNLSFIIHTTGVINAYMIKRKQRSSIGDSCNCKS